MKKTLVSLLASVAFIGAAMAADIPSKATPAAPAPAASSSAFGLDGFYVGGFAGGDYSKVSHINLSHTPYVIGGVAGYEWNRYFRTEATFDYTSKNKPTTTKSGETLFGNAIVQYPIGFGITPYVLGGVGYGWGSWDKVGNYGIDRTLYNVGGGVRYSLTKNLELDGRYRYINAATGPKFNDNNVVTLGVNYKF